MPISDITKTSTLSHTIEDHETSTEVTEGVSESGEKILDNNDFSENYGIYKNTGLFKKALHSFANWIVGGGFKAKSIRDQVVLDHVRGMGDDTINSIFWSGLIVKKFHGRYYAHIVRDEKSNIIINLKPLDPASMITILGEDGIIIRHEQISKIKGKKNQEFKPKEIFYLVNDRIADDGKGDAVSQNVKWVVEAREEAMRDWKRISHRSTVRILYVDENDPTALTNLKRDYAEAIEKGEVLIIPGKPKDAGFQDLNLPPVEAFLAWIRYLENVFYKEVGFPKSLTGDAEGIPESGGKMARLNFEPTYLRELKDLEDDIWNQLGIRGTFKEQVSLAEGMNDTANKSNAQTGFQPSDTEVGAVE